MILKTPQKGQEGRNTKWRKGGTKQRQGSKGGKQQRRRTKAGSLNERIWERI